MRVQYGLSAFQRAEGDLPELPVVNMYAEQAATEEGGVVLQSRPPLQDRGANMGSVSVQALFKGDGVLDSALYGVSDGTLYRETSPIGLVNGNGPFSMAGYEDYLFVAGGSSLWSYDGTTLAAVAFPDSANVIKCLVGASRLICIRENTETFYWSDALSTTIGALSFATAEKQPDRLRDALFISDTLWLFGAETVEPWPNTTDPDLPFQPLEGSAYNRGIKNTGAASKFGAGFAWVTDSNQVCLDSPENVVSLPGFEALIAESAAAYVWNFFIDGTEFLAVRIDAGTWVLNRRTGTFSQFESYGQENWIAQCYAGGVFGSAIDGKTYAWGSSEEPFERRFRYGFPLNSGGRQIQNVSLRCNVGQTTYLAGQYADPVIEMRLSRDAGKTWGEWRPTTLGEQGNYRKKVQWRNCGMASRPGLIGEVRFTAPVQIRISDVLVNEGNGGR